MKRLTIDEVYLLSEIAQIIEENDAKILNLYPIDILFPTVTALLGNPPIGKRLTTLFTKPPNPGNPSAASTASVK